MVRLESRLRKLEARLTDHSRLVRHTQKWFDYWLVRLDKLIAGEPPEELMPISFLDALMARADADLTSAAE